MSWRRRAVAGITAAITLAASNACVSDQTSAGSSSSDAPQAYSSSTPPAARESSLGEPRILASGLEAPWSVAFHGETALISERDSARILELTRNGETREVGVIENVSAAGEAGLLGLAVREDYLYVYSTAEDENRIRRYAIEGEPGSLGLGRAETILDGLPVANWHGGGRIAFGPDGMLYATVGDVYTPSSAQDLDELSGKILRMTADGQVPDDNPFPDSYVYSFGHRNPQGLAWGPDGTLYSSEFGEDAWDELNVIEPGGNYGWPEAEGVVDGDEFIDPIQQWEPSSASPSGMVVAGDSIWIANLRGTVLRQVPLDDPAAATEHLAGEHGRLRDAVLAPDGALWVLTNNTDGRGDPGPDDDRILRFELG